MSSRAKLCVFPLLLFLLSETHQSCYNPSTIIKHESTGLVLDGGTMTQNVQVKNFTQYPTQLWKLISTCDGTFYIKNIGNRYFLDIEGAEEGHKVILSYDYRRKKQKWFVNWDGSLVPAGNATLAVRVGGANETVLGLKNDGSEDSIFKLECFCYNRSAGYENKFGDSWVQGFCFNQNKV